MTDRDKLIELMQAWGTENTDSFPFESVADYLIANGVTVNAWISVEERLPNYNEEVMLCTKDDYGNIFYDLGEYECDGGFLCNGIHRDETITHWMPLPHPPKGEKE